MPARDLGIAPWKGEVVVVAAAGGQLHDPEGAPDEIGPAPPRQRPDQLVVTDAENLDVKVLVRQSEQAIPHAAADQAGGFEFAGFRQDFRQFVRKRQCHVSAARALSERGRAMLLHRVPERQRAVS